MGSANNCGPGDTEGSCWINGLFSAISFAVGGLTSMLSGYIGMKIAVYANVRTTVSCQYGWMEGFNTAFRAGSVMGFALCSLALLVLFATINLFRLRFAFSDTDLESTRMLFEAIAGYGLGGSSIALFGRVGGGIYTKAADVGADLVGKTENNLNEDDERNPAVIADNVGDNVGDVAGMGADLFGSFAESTCAALVVSSTLQGLVGNWAAMMFPLLISAMGIMVCIVTSLFATDIPGLRVSEESHVQRNLKLQLILSTVLMTPLIYVLAVVVLPDSFCAKNDALGVCVAHSTPLKAFACVVMGLWAGLIIGVFTEVMTSHSYRPVREVAEACEQGPAINIIFGLALGYKSNIVPTFALAATVFGSLTLADMYGVALAALGILSTLAVGLTIDAYGPISDNAGGIAEMAHMGAVRERTDALDAAGNTTAAIGKGFAIGSAALVSLALFGAFVTRARIVARGVDLLQPIAFAGLMVGAMLPYWFSAMTMKSVGKAAREMVNEVRRQLQERPGILTGAERPDYASCVAISTRASLREMIAPGALVMLSPLVVGFFFGKEAVAGLLAGGLVSGVQVAISASNTGGAWDNAKKYIEKNGEKGSDAHKAAVIGDTVGDPLKDTSGPALNILMKLMAIISLVFAPFITQRSLNWGA